MKHSLLLFSALILCSIGFAQRLYLHDIQDGNFKSFDVGDKISFQLFDSTQVIDGKITSFTANGFYINDSLKVEISQVASLLVQNRKGSTGPVSALRVLAVIGGSVLCIYGVGFVIGGIGVLLFESTVGLVVVVIGAAMITGGIAIIAKKQNRKSGFKEKMIDNKQYRLLIE
jgi:hypothetical protein